MSRTMNSRDITQRLRSAVMALADKTSAEEANLLVQALLVTMLNASGLTYNGHFVHADKQSDITALLSKLTKHKPTDRNDYFISPFQQASPSVSNVVICRVKEKSYAILCEKRGVITWPAGYMNIHPRGMPKDQKIKLADIGLDRDIKEEKILGNTLETSENKAEVTQLKPYTLEQLFQVCSTIILDIYKNNGNRWKGVDLDKIDFRRLLAEKNIENSSVDWSFRDCSLRELKEETGLDVTLYAPIIRPVRANADIHFSTGCFRIQRPQDVDMLYLVDLGEQDSLPKLTAGPEMTSVQWTNLESSEFKKITNHSVKYGFEHAIRCYWNARIKALSNGKAESIDALFKLSSKPHDLKKQYNTLNSHMGAKACQFFKEIRTEAKNLSVMKKQPSYFKQCLTYGLPLFAVGVAVGVGLRATFATKQLMPS